MATLNRRLVATEDILLYCTPQQKKQETNYEISRSRFTQEYVLRLLFK